MKRLIVICGPTASGKTALAIEIAQYFNTEIISADSRQFYRELNIGTAKPSPEQLASVKHHFINNISIHEEYNAGKYEIDAIEKINSLFREYDTLVLTGGSGLYINAVLYGFDQLPKSDAEIRKKLTEAFNKDGISFLQQEILRHDPLFAANTDINNPQRLIRALEVIQLTGLPYSAFKTAEKKQRLFEFEIYCLDVEREELYGRINNRTDEMITNGLIKEAESLYIHKHLNSLQTVGYEEIFQFLDGKTSKEKAIELIKQHTRNYAKRQLTWFRKMDNVVWVNPVGALQLITKKKETQ